MRVLQPRLRWVHALTHPDVPVAVPAGGCCAARRCLGYDAGAAERAWRDRRARFVDSRGWRPSRRNPANVCRVVRFDDRMEVMATVYPSDGGFRFVLADLETGETLSDRRLLYRSREDAVAALFDITDEAGDR